MKHSVLVPIALGAMLFGGGLSAETLWETQVHDQIDEASYRFRQEGFYKIGTTWIDELEEGDDGYITLELDDDVEYIAIAVCDEDCLDIDLVLYDEDEDPIAEDISTDDIPILAGSPDFDGEYYLEVVMEDCAADTCAFGIAIYAR